MKMVKIQECNASECAYNSENICHALAITIGHDEGHPMCDTFSSSEMKGGEKGIVAGVGACKVSSCEYNKSLECHASSIKVGYKSDEVDCLTFKQR